VPSQGSSEAGYVADFEQTGPADSRNQLMPDSNDQSAEFHPAGTGSARSLPSYPVKLKPTPCKSSTPKAASNPSQAAASERQSPSHPAEAHRSRWVATVAGSSPRTRRYAPTTVHYLQMAPRDRTRAWTIGTS
jgi:hypothetical protein